MSWLVEKLKREHAEILKTIEVVKMYGISSKSGQDTLMSVKDRLLEHLQNEDEQLYPVLRNAARDNPELNKLLEVFAKDMENISQVAMEFFAKYSGGGCGMEFARDFGRLTGLLSQRIIKEGSILYEEYDKLEKP